MTKMNLAGNDLKAISEKIHLSLAKTKSLTEEESDLDLLLSTISENNFNKKDKTKLTFNTYCHLIFSKIIKDLNYKEKSWVADTISTHFHTFKRTKKQTFDIPTKFKDEDTAFYFTLLALFPDTFCLSIHTDRLKVRIENGLHALNHKELARNLDSYLKIIKLAQDEGWFD